MRLIFIPGFGEKPSIFDQIETAFDAEKLFIDNWLELDNTLLDNYKVIDYAAKLVDKYKITDNDVVIGHSMGGWIAYHIKHLSKSRVVQIASWTDQDRVKFPVKSHRLIRVAVRTGLSFNRFSKSYFIKKQYQGLPSEAIYAENFDRLRFGNKNNVLNQLNLILLGSEINGMDAPDLRIHSQADVLIRYPKQKFEAVPGDHFNLHTHPKEVIQCIKIFLDSI